jgi:hydroxymethylbilane synthase
VTRLVLGTRGSDLARAQTLLVENAVCSADPTVEVVVKIITTRGDEKSDQGAAIDPRAGRKGLFTGEIERALAAGEIDVAVHSAKDLPSDATPGLEVCAALRRASIEDVLVMKMFSNLAELPPRSTIATGSVRRQHQLRWLRPDLDVSDLRGNVPTRLRKLIANPWEGIILARAGLERLGFDCARGAIDFEEQRLHIFLLPTDDFAPAGGQGIVALQIRSDDANTRGLVEKLSHADTLLCLRAEREFLRLLHGDCGTPVGVFAILDESGSMTIRAQFFDGKRAEPRVATLRKEKARSAPEAIASELLELINGG